MVRKHAAHWYHFLFHPKKIIVMKEAPNLNYIKELAAGSPDFEKRIIDIMKREFPEERNEFSANYSNKKYIEAAEIVHKLKHKIGMLGLEESYHIARDFEHELRDKNPALFPKFVLILKTIQEFLDNL